MSIEIDPGELGELLKLYTRGTPTKDGYGHETLAWTALPDAWAKYVPARADERFAAAQTQDDIAVRFFMRTRTDLDSTCRLAWNGAYYDITAATPLPGRQWMEVIARKGVKDGR
jgi:SPP1 family predicted phage head-tail adaptor